MTALLVVLATSCASQEQRPAAAPLGVRYSGGDGSICEARVIIAGARDEGDGVAAEYQWLKQHLPGYQMQMQSLTQCAGRPADRLHVQTPERGEQDVFFDIGDFFGKL